jgi:hypothetical protein
MLKTKNKGGEMTIATIVAIALAVVVLIFLIYGFTTGWNNLFGKITAIGGGSSNVDTIALACSTAASTQSMSYCTTIQKLVTGDDKKIDGTCFALEKAGHINPTATIKCKEPNNKLSCKIGEKDSANCRTVDKTEAEIKADCEAECTTGDAAAIATCKTKC